MNGPFTLLQDVMSRGGGYDWGMGHGPGMMGWGYGTSWFGHIIMMAFWIALIIGIIVFIRWLVLSTRSETQKKDPENSALEILKKRYARGEINKEEFEEKKRDLIA